MNQPPSRKAKWREKKEAADGKGGFYTLKPPPTSEEATLCVVRTFTTRSTFSGGCGGRGVEKKASKSVYKISRIYRLWGLASELPLEGGSVSVREVNSMSASQKSSFLLLPHGS